MESKITILVVEDHPIVSSSICDLLRISEDFEVVGVAATASEVFFELKQHNKIDVILLDLMFPAFSKNQRAEPQGFIVLEFIKKEGLDTKVIMMTSYDDLSIVQRAINLGAVGFLTKKANQKQFREAIRQVVIDKKPYIEKHIDDKLNRKEDSIELTEREKQVLVLIGQGYTSKEIGISLHLSSETIRDYRNSIMGKLDAKNSSNLIQKAFQKGFLV